MANWWREPDMRVLSAPVAAGEASGCAAQRMWRNACNTLVAPDADAAWNKIVDASPPDSLWHTLRNCVAYQAGVWQNLLNKGMDDVIQPAAFKLAIVLRHTPSELTVKLLSDLLCLHPQSQDLMSYILALLTDDEALCGGTGTCTSESSSPSSSDSSTDSSSSVEETDEAEAIIIEETNEAEAAEPVVKSNIPREPMPVDSGTAVAAADSSENPMAPDSPPESPKPSGALSPMPSGDGSVSGSGVCSGPGSAVGSAAGSEAASEAGSEAGSEVGSEEGSEEGSGSGSGSGSPGPPPGPAPLRDLQLFGDCELAVLAASREEYDAHAKLVRAEYSKLTNDNYVELRIKILNQFSQIPKLYHTPEFECLESAARENIEREICTLREHLLTGRRD